MIRIHIKDSHDLTLAIVYGQCNLRSGTGVAADMAGKAVHIRHQHRYSAIYSCPADPLVFCKLLASYRPLIGTHDQFALLQQVKTSPEIMIHLVVKHGTYRSHSGQRIPGKHQQILELFIYADIASCFLCIVHAKYAGLSSKNRIIINFAAHFH